MYIFNLFQKSDLPNCDARTTPNLACNQMQFNHNNLLPWFSLSKPLPPAEIKIKNFFEMPFFQCKTI
jgi:hypothetical protein